MEILIFRRTKIVSSMMRGGIFRNNFHLSKLIYRLVVNSVGRFSHHPLSQACGRFLIAEQKYSNRYQDTWITNHYAVYLGILSGVGSRGDRQELRVSAWAQMSANNMIAIIKWLQEALKMLMLTKYTLNWCTLKFFAIFCNLLQSSFWFLLKH